MSKEKNICIRNDRDAIQISRCKAELDKIRMKTIGLSRTYSLIGNEVRLAILILLHQETVLCVCDLAEILEMTVPAVSQHLKKLRVGHLVTTEREGTTIFYSVAEEMKPILKELLHLMPVDRAMVA